MKTTNPMTNENIPLLLEKAIGIAVTAHRGQVDKSGAPYILHPLRVMHRMETDAERIVAILHDVIEDTAVTHADLVREGFPPEILEALADVTKREGEHYEAFVMRAAANPIARRVKLGDLHDNLDVRRLNALTERDIARVNKYLKAVKALAQ